MTTDIEKQFFVAFGIKTEERFYCKKGYCNQNPSVKENSLKCRECENGVYYIFPEITDRILLELICILRNSYLVTGENIDVLKERALRACIRFQDDLVTIDQTVKQQVQALFKEE